MALGAQSVSSESDRKLLALPGIAGVAGVAGTGVAGGVVVLVSSAAMVTFFSLLDASTVLLSTLEGFFVNGFRKLTLGFLGSSGGASGASFDESESELGGSSAAEIVPGAAAVLRTFGAGCGTFCGVDRVDSGGASGSIAAGAGRSGTALPGALRGGGFTDASSGASAPLSLPSLSGGAAGGSSCCGAVGTGRCQRQPGVGRGRNPTGARVGCHPEDTGDPSNLDGFPGLEAAAGEVGESVVGESWELGDQLKELGAPGNGSCSG